MCRLLFIETNETVCRARYIQKVSAYTFPIIFLLRSGESFEIVVSTRFIYVAEQ